MFPREVAGRSGAQLRSFHCLFSIWSLTFLCSSLIPPNHEPLPHTAPQIAPASVFFVPLDSTGNHLYDPPSIAHAFPTMATKKVNAPGLAEKKEIYSHVTVAGGLIYVSGQVPADETGKIVPGDIKAHTKQCIQNIEKALKAVGVGLENLVKVNIFVKDMGDFNALNEVYSQVRKRAWATLPT